MHRKRLRRLRQNDLTNEAVSVLTQSDVELAHRAASARGQQGIHVWLDWTQHDNKTFAAAVLRHVDEAGIPTMVAQQDTTLPTDNTTDARAAAMRAAADLLDEHTITEDKYLYVPSEPLLDILVAETLASDWERAYRDPYERVNTHSPAIHTTTDAHYEPAVRLVERGPYNETTPYWNATAGIGLSDRTRQKTGRLMDEPLVRCIIANAVLGNHPLLYRDHTDKKSDYHALYADYAVPVAVDGSAVTAMTQMHKHPDYNSDENYTVADSIEADAAAMTIAHNHG